VIVHVTRVDPKFGATLNIGIGLKYWNGSFAPRADEPSTGYNQEFPRVDQASPRLFSLSLLNKSVLVAILDQFLETAKVCVAFTT
jgi:hypothetical protein